jgi:hypothetical protein
MTDSQRVADLLQHKFNKIGTLSGDEDYMLEFCRERAIEEQANFATPRRKLSNKRSDQIMVTQAEVDRIAKRAFAKAMHLSDADEQHLRNLRDTVKAAAEHVSKISFDDRAPEGSELETRNPETDATMPSKSAKPAGVDVNLLKGRDLARLVGTACAKAAQSRPMNMNPARSDQDIPTMPGKPLAGLPDAGGELAEPTRDELENLARGGNATAVAALMQRAMKPAVLATRY